MNKPNIKREVIIGCSVIILFFGVFGLWATFAPLESAAIAPGTITIAGKHKSIQHLEGGIVKSLNIKENSVVKKGQVLLTLQETHSKASLQIIHYDLYEQIAIRTRLLAELKDKHDFKFPDSIPKNSDNKRIQSILDAQRSIFHSNHKTLHGMIAIHEKRIAEINEQIEGLEDKYKANQKQLELIATELKDVKILAEKRLIKKSRLLSLQREEARLQGQLGESKAAIDNNERKIAEIELEIHSVKNKHRKELLALLHETQQQLAELTEKQRAQTDVLTRTTIRAPISGRIVGLKVHTIGGVVSPGEVLMDIVPSNAHMLVEAKVSPLDIDIVVPGLIAKVRVSVFRQRDVPLLIGKVTEVSADSFKDERTGESYYLAQIDLPDKQIAKLPGGSVYPGMPVEVMIITQESTPWRYFIAPIHRSFNKAFREE
ncbi:MAG: HlyD family type I secretion periplasmic adaptor subunit [Coxiellaceae bacterium]|nr:HlyD family type I secretion periplasmic adaptor subunit [Coxiellaceae bacterium]